MRHIHVSWRHIYAKARCAACQRLLKLGEEVERTNSSNRSFTTHQYYCLKCASKPLLVYQPTQRDKHDT